MLQSVLSKFFGTKQERDLKKLQPLLDEVNEKEPSFKALSDEQLSSMTNEFKVRLAKGETLDDLLPEAYAVVREAAIRTLGQRHFDVQVMGAIVLHQGMIAEMKTGEGKTLASTMPVYLNALTGKGVHVVTPNYYLAYRDSEWMGAIYKFLGLSVGLTLSSMSVRDGRLVTEDMTLEEKKQAYNADITYGTNDAFGFDYLRDNKVSHLVYRVQRGLNYAIVDEVDSILIDEARTPLILSDRPQKTAELYYTIDRIIPSLKQDADYNVDYKNTSRGTVALTEEGIEHVEKLLRAGRLLGDGNLYDVQNIGLVHHVEQALAAHTLWKLDVDYVVKDGKVIIVDEFTGRLQPGRRWSDGLHQAIEAKERVRIEEENLSTARITYQNYFRLYSKLAGMTGTAETESAEFSKIYNLDVAVIPTNETMIRVDHPDVIYRTEREKFGAIIEEIVQMHNIGRPVLVGTRAIETSERLSAMLKQRHIPHHVLNANYHDQEAEIILRAGDFGAVTIATNMAGRGVDIAFLGKWMFNVKSKDELVFSSVDLRLQKEFLFSTDAEFLGKKLFDAELELRDELSRVLLSIFKTDSKYQDDLSSGRIPKGLRQDFKENDVPLSTGATAIFRSKDGSRWLINPKQVLFSVELRYRKDLDNSSISEDLRQEFRENGRILLSQNATVSVEEENSLWLITDREKRYHVREEEYKLNVYEEQGPYMIEEDTVFSRFIQESISGIEESRWLIFDEQEVYSIKEDKGGELDVSKELARYQESIPVELRRKFENEGISLSDSANIVPNGENRWLINDGQQQKYLISEDKDGLKIYTRDFGSGTMPEELQREFRNKGLSLSDKHTFLVGATDNEWSITDDQWVYSLEIENDKLNVYRDSLDSGIIPPELRQEFENNTSPLSDKAGISPRIRSIEWLIKDDQLVYSVKRESNKLNVYRDSLDSGIIPEWLPRKFGNFKYKSKDPIDKDFIDKDFSLSDKATVSVQTMRSSWLIFDDQQIYLIKRKNENEKELDVYLEAIQGWPSLSEEVRELGGLHVIGTERHESRRIDNQLRGRSGRQGDPGSSRFYLSLEDELMRSFGSERLSNTMEWLGMKEGVPIEHPWVSKSIENAQKRVESHYFEYRKHILERDDVRNTQRKVIYDMRNMALEGEIIEEDGTTTYLKDVILTWIEDTVDDYLDMYVGEKIDRSEWDVQGLMDQVRKTFLVDISGWVPKPENLSYEEIREKLLKTLLDLHEEREKDAGSEIMREFERRVTLDRIDDHWVDHLLSMDYMEEGIHLRAYGQKDPLVEFKREAYDMFYEMIGKIKEEAVEYIFKVQSVERTKVQPVEKTQEQRPPQERRRQRRAAPRRRTAVPVAEAVAVNAPAYSGGRKVGRNDPCPCGSGKKYKKCCGR